MAERIDALHGALVADAATMGLHWMYDHPQIDKLEQCGDLLFRQPQANDYQGVKAYFAHEARRAGEFSQYGEAAKVLAKSIAINGSYDTAIHRQMFFDTFGPCGSYHGFADRPTQALIAKIILEGEDIADASGSDDDQLPALCAVPGVFYHELDEATLRTAVSVTTINEQAISGSVVLHNCLTHLVSGVPLQEALRKSIDKADRELAALLTEALEFKPGDDRAVVNHFGLPCHIPQGLPVAWHLLQHASGFESVVRDNVRCGGDSCGRAMAIGSIAGLVFGVPAELKQKVHYFQSSL